MGARTSIVFESRTDAGRRLAVLLSGLFATRPLVLGLPRGGVPVAAEVARALHAPLDVILVRKLGVPYQPELAVGAIGEDGVRVLNEDVRRAARVSDRDLTGVEARERETLEHMAREFRRGRPPIAIRSRTVVVVDDGIATGATARAACQVARVRGAARIVLAAPVIPTLTLSALHDVADDVVCVESPDPFFAIGQWYVDFSQTTDDEVVRLLEEASPTSTTGPTARRGPGSEPILPAPRDSAPRDSAPRDTERNGR